MTRVDDISVIKNKTPGKIIITACDGVYNRQKQQTVQNHHRCSSNKGGSQQLYILVSLAFAKGKRMNDIDNYYNRPVINKHITNTKYINPLLLLSFC